MSELFDRVALVHQRNRSASRYFDRTELPGRVESELLERLSVLTLQPDNVLVLGAVRSESLITLCERFPTASFTVTDSAEDLLKRMHGDLSTETAARVRFEVTPPNAVSVTSDPFDLVFSNLYVPLCDDLNALFATLHGLMRPDACLHFSALGPDSFRELHRAWKAVDPDHPFHTLVFPDMHDVGDALVYAGFREPVMDRDNYTLTYSTVEAMFADLRSHGIGNAFSDRRKGLTGRGVWRRVLQQLEALREDDRIPLTAELVIGQAWRGDGMTQQRRPDGGVGISLEALAHKLRNEQGDP